MSKLPKISVIMPTTYARRPFLAHAIEQFQAQTYPTTELIIIDDSWSPLNERQVETPPLAHNIKYVQVLCDDDISIGAKRNLACSLASGEIICHMDDDDWIGAESLASRVEPIIQGKATVTACKMRLCYDLSTQTMWRCSDELHARLFRHDMRGSTLMYKKYFWNERSCYRNTSRGEDMAFFSLLYGAAASIGQIDDPSCYICIRHEGNVTDGFEYGPPEWEEVPVEQYLPQADIAFYTRCAQPPGASNVGKRFFSDVHSGVDFPEGASKR